MAQTEILKKNPKCFCVTYRFISKSKNMTSIFQFKLGKTMRAYTYSNSFTKNKVFFNENKIISVQKGQKEIHSTREYFPTHMIMTIECNGRTAKRFYRAVGHDDSMFDEKRCCVNVDDQSNKNNLVYWIKIINYLIKISSIKLN